MKKTQFSFLLSGDQIYFDFLSLTDHQKKNQKSWKMHVLGKSRYILYFAKFHTEILWWKSIHCEPTSHNCHTELPYDLSEQHHGIIHRQLCSLCNIKIHFLIPILTSLSPSLAHDAWKRFSQSSHSTALQYFLQRRHWNLGPGFISISPARMRRVIRLVPFEGLKLRNLSELLQFPSFLVYAKKWDTPLLKVL